MAVLSKSAYVERYLRGELLRGTWAPGDRLASDGELCRQLGTSLSTLSNVMTRLAGEGLLVRRQRLGTCVADDVQTGTVALLSNLAALTSPLGYYYREVIESAQRQVDGAGYLAKLETGHGVTPEAFGSSIHLFDEPSTRNLLGVISTVDMGPFSARLDERGVPYVSIVAHRPTHGPCVVFDRRKLCRIGMKALLERGYRNIAVLAGDGPDAAENARTNGELLTWLREAAPDFPADRLVTSPFAAECASAYEMFLTVWREARPDAILFLDDGLFDVASRAILELGIQVPEDLALITQSNAGRRFHFPVPVARVEFDPAAAVRTAWQMLERLIGRESIGKDVVYQSPRLVEGESLPRRKK